MGKIKKKQKYLENKSKKNRLCYSYAFKLLSIYKISFYTVFRLEDKGDFRRDCGKIKIKRATHNASKLTPLDFNDYIYLQTGLE